MFITGLARLPGAAEAETPGCFGQGSQPMIFRVFARLVVPPARRQREVQATGHTKLPYSDLPAGPKQPSANVPRRIQQSLAAAAEPPAPCHRRRRR